MPPGRRSRASIERLRRSRDVFDRRVRREIVVGSKRLHFDSHFLHRGGGGGPLAPSCTLDFGSVSRKRRSPCAKTGQSPRRHVDIPSAFSAPTSSSDRKDDWLVTSFARTVARCPPHRAAHQVIDIYVRGGRNVDTGPFAGDGAASPQKSDLIVKIDRSQQEKADLIAFLKTLTDATLLTSPRFSDPWK